MPSESSILRPAAAAVVLVAAVVLTAFVLAAWWPGGVALGVALGAGAVLAVGTRMQRSNARVQDDEALVERLGVATAAARRVEPAVAAPRVTVPAVQPLHAQADDIWFTTGRSETRPAVATVAPEPLVDPEPEPLTGAQPEPADAQPEPEPVARVEPEPADAQPDPGEVQDAHAEQVEDEVQDAVDEGEEDDEPDTIPATDFVLVDESTVRSDLERLKVELGEDYSDFARAVRLVVETQYASAARLQRDLAVPYSRARRLLSDLEEQHFVGPATGSLPRVVLMPKDRLPEVERLLEEV